MNKVLKILILVTLLFTGCSMQPVEYVSNDKFYENQVGLADCGAAVTVMMSKFIGKPMTINYAKNIAMRNDWWLTTTVADVLYKQGIPYSLSDNLYILSDNNKGMAIIIQRQPGISLTNHMVFLQGLQGDSVKVHDPATGTYWIKIRTLEKYKLKGFGIVVRKV